MSELLTILGGRHGELLALACTGRRAHAKCGRLHAAQVSTPVNMVPSVRSKCVAFTPPGPPPLRPMLAQAAIALLGWLVRRKKGDLHLLAAQHISNQWSHLHMTRVKSEIQWLLAVI